MPKTPDYFAGKTIVITGAASGIGRATALIFAREGANVVCADIDAAGVEKTAEAVNAKFGGKAGRENNAPGKTLALTIDVTKRAAVNDMIDLAIDGFGRVDFLFNSAGSAIRRSKFLDIDDELLDQALDLNFKGTFYAMQAVLPHMLKNGAGVIVNVASMAVKRGGPGTSVHYAAAKGAVNTMTLGVGREFASQGIRCLSISPGPIDTAFAAASATSPELKQKMLDDVPMKRFGSAEEIGELVLFMCSDACPYMTADTVYVNGGGGWR
jgi:NAD(P)-dependent dehydrogenase (short-subunit alcohol dehydrogenase family)